MVMVLTPNAHILGRRDQSARRQNFVKFNKHVRLFTLDLIVR